MDQLSKDMGDEVKPEPEVLDTAMPDVIVEDDEEILSEEKKLDLGFVTKVASMTDSNDHNGARVLIAKTIKHKKYIKIFDALGIIHKAEGSLTTDLSSYRNGVTNEMIANIKTHFGNDVAKAINDAL